MQRSREARAGWSRRNFEAKSENRKLVHIAWALVATTVAFRLHEMGAFIVFGVVEFEIHRVYK